MPNGPTHDPERKRRLRAALEQAAASSRLRALRHMVQASRSSTAVAPPRRYDHLRGQVGGGALSESPYYGADDDNVWMALSAMLNRYGQPDVKIHDERGRAFYRPATKQMGVFNVFADGYVPDGVSRGAVARQITRNDILSELPHAQQYQERPLMIEGYRSLFEKMIHGDPGVYDVPGTHEHEAHEVLEPQMIDEFTRRLQFMRKLQGRPPLETLPPPQAPR